MQQAQVRALNKENPEADWKRWNAELRDKVFALGGQAFVQSLDYDADIPAMAAAFNVLAEDFPMPNVPQMRQHALLALISNSLPDEYGEGSARKLIEDCVHAGGTVAGEPQAYALLAMRLPPQISAGKPRGHSAAG